MRAAEGTRYLGARLLGACPPQHAVDQVLSFNCSRAAHYNTRGARHTAGARNGKTREEAASSPEWHS